MIVSCDNYKEYEPTFSPAYPLCGNFYVKDYLPGAINFENAKTPYYELFIYSASVESEKYLWINTLIRIEETSFKVKSEYNIDELSFYGEMLPSIKSTANPDSIEKYVTIEETQLLKKEWPETDSILFKVTLYDGNQDLDTVFYISGHRMTGQEDQYFDNPLGY